MKVDAAAVEAELARMQRELTSSEVRTSLFNLVVMSPDAQRAMVDEALNYLLGKRAARVIHIVNSTEQESRLDVSARCFTDRERKGVCFQEVIITNGTDEAGGAPGSWIPLLVRDIPTYILWLDTISGREQLFSHVQSQADKVIVDTDHCVELGDEPEALLATLSSVAANEGVPLADFSWKRLRPYQRLTAGAFDGEGREQWLDEIVRISVRGLARMAGELFGLWLAERLGWRRDGKSSHRPTATFVDVRGRPVEFSCSAGEPDCDVEISVDLTDGSVIEVTAGQNGCADVEYPGGSTEHLVTIPSNGEILLEEVDAVYADDLYRSALARGV